MQMTSVKTDFDPDALRSFLRQRFGEGELRLEVIGGGQSNPTYFVDYGARRLVLRKKPDGNLLPSAHAVDREFRVISALRDTGVPVAQARHFCDDPSIVGAMFYIMDYVEGRSFWEPWLPGMEPAERAAIYAEAGRVIAAFGVVYMGQLVALFGNDYGRAMGAVTLVYVIGMVAVWFSPETRGKPLPD